MKTFLTLLIFLLAVILESTVLSSGPVLKSAPNLVLVLALLLVFFKTFRKIWPIILSASVLLDTFAGLPFGLISLSLIAAAYLIDWFNRNVFSGNKLWLAASLIISGTLVYSLLLVVLGKFFDVDLTAGLKELPVKIIYNFLISVILFYGAKKVFS
jgi:hypothetical protein